MKTKMEIKIIIGLCFGAIVFLLSGQSARAVICDCPTGGTYHGPEATIDSISYSNCTLTYSGKITKWPSGYSNCANGAQPSVDRVWATLKSMSKSYTIPGYCLNKDGVYCKYYAQRDNAVCARVPSIPGPMPTQSSNSFSYSKKIYLAAGTYEVYAAAGDGSEIYADKYGSCSASKTDNILPNEASRSVKTSMTLTVSATDAQNCLTVFEGYPECSSGGSCGDGTIQDINGEQCEAGNDPCSVFGASYGCNTATCKCEKKAVTCNKDNICQPANGEDQTNCSDCVPGVSNLPVGNVASDSIEFRANVDRLADWNQGAVNFDWYQVGGGTGLTSAVIKSSIGEAMYKLENLSPNTKYCYNARLTKYPNLTNEPAVAAVNGWVCATTAQSNQMCGDNKCTGTENSANCEKDCGTCGNGTCEKTAPPAKCPADNVSCAWKIGETDTNCVVDCFGKNSRIKTINPVNVKTDSISFMGEVLDDNNGQSQYFFKWWKKGEELIGEKQTIKMNAREGFTPPFVQNGLLPKTEYCYRACIEDKIASPVPYCDPAPAICTSTAVIDNNDCNNEFVSITKPMANADVDASTIDGEWHTWRNDSQDPKCDKYFQYYAEGVDPKLSIKSLFYSLTMPVVEGTQQVKIYVRGCMDGTCADNKATAWAQVLVNVSNSCDYQFVGNKQFLDKTKESNPLTYNKDFYVKTISYNSKPSDPTYYKVMPDGTKNQIYNGKVAQHNLIYVQINKPELKYSIQDGGLMGDILKIDTGVNARMDYVTGGPKDIASTKSLPVQGVSPDPQFGMAAGPNENPQEGLYRVDSTAFTKVSEDADGIYLFVYGTTGVGSSHKIIRPQYFTYQTLGNKYFNSGCYPDSNLDIALTTNPTNKAPRIISMSMDPIVDCKTLKLHALAQDPECEDVGKTPEQCSAGLKFYWQCNGPTGPLEVNYGSPGEVHGMNPTISDIQVSKNTFVKCTVTVFDTEDAFINSLVAGKIGMNPNDSSERTQQMDINLPQCSQKPLFDFGAVLAEECVSNPRLSINWWGVGNQPLPEINQAKLFIGNSMSNWFSMFAPLTRGVVGGNSQFLTESIPVGGNLVVGLQLKTNTGIESDTVFKSDIYFPDTPYNIPTISSAETNFMTGEVKFMVKNTLSGIPAKDIIWYVFDKTSFPNITKAKCYEWPADKKVGTGPEFKQTFNLGDNKFVGVCVNAGPRSCGDMVEKKPGSYPRFGSGGGGGGSD